MTLASTDADYGVLTAPDTVRVERLLPGPITRVWRYLTEPDLRAQWFAGGPMAPHPGGAVALVFKNSELTEHDDPAPAKYARQAGTVHSSGTITDFDPPHLLGFLWGEGEDASHVRFELSERGEQVRLVVIHSRLSSAGMILSVSGGWHTHLDILGDCIAGRTPEGFWRKHTRLEAEYAKRLGL
ncbi:Uncharacterized conserved protein YndB, AHSA1/START domain [Pseudoxanthomonas sp. GM95]|uniref:SRPBCC family protein n=1 Tax=Pseudoxanthomonas sp. GM95 TaxID=1881043 RepID=UPI0008B93A07|nr:SRPBCC family protein [Pseudoxanthomonas sp. GM95]SEL52675.1 Uncharacterized conserved protein YndB, AHSA1/START domain [Pseudoxanthomonas sp. GM95]